MTEVKICGLTNASDARWAWQSGADLLGFIFVRSSPRYVSPLRVGEITHTLRDEGCEALFVGVFAGEDVATVEGVASSAGLDIVQLHKEGDEALLASLSVPAILTRRVRDAAPCTNLNPAAWAYLFDTYHPDLLGGTGEHWRWDLLAGRPQDGPRVIISGGLTPENVEEAVRLGRPWGVDVSSGVEESPGRKDPRKVQEFIRRAKGGDDER